MLCGRSSLEVLDFFLSLFDGFLGGSSLLSPVWDCQVFFLEVPDDCVGTFVFKG